MSDGQLDLFARVDTVRPRATRRMPAAPEAIGVPQARHDRAPAEERDVTPYGDHRDLFVWAETDAIPGVARSNAIAEMSDSALIAAIELGLQSYAVLAAEAGRRRLEAAVGPLGALCRRIGGENRAKAFEAQAAALRALAAIGGPTATVEVTLMIGRNTLQGPGLVAAMDAAARLRAVLPVDVLRGLLAHANAAIRTDACRCVRTAEQAGLLVPCLHDPDRQVRNAAACALGCVGNSAALPALTELLRRAPTVEAIEAAAMVADETCMVLLGRVAREVPRLADAALEALDNLDDELAGRIAAAVRTSRQSARELEPG